MRHSVSIIPGTLFIASFCVLGCPPSQVNPVTSKVQQNRYERLALGFQTTPAAVVFLELRDAKEPAIRQHRLDRVEERDLMAVDATLAGLLADEHTARQVIIDSLAASSMGGRLEALGMRWATPRPSPLATSLGKIERRGELIVARADEATEATLATLGSAIMPESDFWVASREGDVIAVELTYPGTPRVRDLRVFQVAQVDAQLALLRAEQALERGADAEAKDRLTFAAERLQPGDTRVAVVAFTRARVAARAGDVDTSVTELKKAAGQDTRYRDQAVKHRDFEGVRKDPRFVDFLMLAPP